MMATWDRRRFTAACTDAYRRDLADLADLAGRLTDVGARVVIVLGPAPPGEGIDLTPYDDASSAVARAARVDLVDRRGTPVTPGSQTRVAAAIAKVLGPIR